MFYYTCTSGIESYILAIVQSPGTVEDAITMIITHVINCTQVTYESVIDCIYILQL